MQLEGSLWFQKIEEFTHHYYYMWIFLRLIARLNYVVFSYLYSRIYLSFFHLLIFYRPNINIDLWRLEKMHYQSKVQALYQIRNQSLTYVITVITILLIKFEIFANNKQFFTTRTFPVGIFDIWFVAISIYSFLNWNSWVINKCVAHICNLKLRNKIGCR